MLCDAFFSVCVFLIIFCTLHIFFNVQKYAIPRGDETSIADMKLQWNFQIKDTFGTSRFVLYTEVVLQS